MGSLSLRQLLAHLSGRNPAFVANFLRQFHLVASPGFLSSPQKPPSCDFPWLCFRVFVPGSKGGLCLPNRLDHQIQGAVPRGVLLQFYVFSTQRRKSINPAPSSVDQITYFRSVRPHPPANRQGYPPGPPPLRSEKDPVRASRPQSDLFFVAVLHPHHETPFLSHNWA